MAVNKQVQDILDRIQIGSSSARDEEELRNLAENLYKAQLTSALENAQNTYNTESANVASQRDIINQNYDNQRDSQMANNQQSVAAVDRASMGRGMQRSSYNANNVANLRASGDEALNKIEQARTNALNALGQQQNALNTNYQNSVNSANSQYQSNVIARIQQMQDNDRTAAENARNNDNSTLLNLAQLVQKYGGSGGSNSSGGSTVQPVQPIAGSTQTPTSRDYADPTTTKTPTKLFKNRNNIINTNTPSRYGH